MTKQIAAITHNQATGGIAITSTYGYVDIESLRVNGNVIGLSTDVDIITLADGAVAIDGTLGVTGATTLASTLDVHGNLKVATDKFHVTAVNGNTVVGGTLGVTGATTLSGALGVTGASILAGAATLQSTLSVAGNTAIEGTLSVDGAVTVAGKLVQTPPICLPPGGSLSYNGTHYTCVCMLKYSGVQCEVPPSISRTESTSETIVPRRRGHIRQWKRGWQLLS